MVSAETVNGDKGKIKSIEESLTLEIEGLSNSWKGPSYDNFKNETNSFKSTFFSDIESQMSSFANACNIYNQQYLNAKENLEIVEKNYNIAVASKDNKGMSFYSQEITKYKEKVEALKSQIERLLTTITKQLTATSKTYDATSTNIQFSSSLTSQSSTTTSASGQINLIGDKVIDTSQPVETGQETFDDLSEEDINYLAYVASKEQGSVEGAKIELSLMTNLYKKYGSNYSSLRSYVTNSGWFSRNSTSNYYYPGDDYVAAAKDVLWEGNRYLTSNIDEHDCEEDILWIQNGNKILVNKYTDSSYKYDTMDSIRKNAQNPDQADIEYVGLSTIKDKSNYNKDETMIYNKYDSRYIFTGYAPDYAPNEPGDPFGYTV